MTATLPWHHYSSPEVLADEIATVFTPAWHYVGHVGDLPEPVGFFPTSVAGLPVVVTRAGDGEVRALVNVCTHRGTVVCSRADARETLVCPYHAWRFELDGTLRSAPRSDREPDFDPAAFPLEPVRVGRWGPFIFVAVSPDAPDFDTWLADLPERVADAGIDVDSLVFHHRAQSTLAANWKVCVENFLECYHCRIAHPDFSKAIDTSPDEYLLETTATYSTQYGPVRERWSGDFDPRGPVERGQFHLIYPNTIINIMPGHSNLSIGPVIPDGPTTTDRFLDYFFAPGVAAEWITDMLAFDDQVGAEDVVLVETMQRGLSARPQGRGVLFVDSELLIEHFDQYLASRMPPPST